jgi:exosortase A-associated hydrolase 1
MFNEQAISFDCDGMQLNGILHPGTADVTAKTGVLIVVGGPQYRVGSHRQFVHLARSLASNGVPVMRFDVTGMGDSDGEKRAFYQLNSDIRAAIDIFMAHLVELDGVVLWGLCDGASAALIYAPPDCRVKGLVLVNPWLENSEARAKTYLFNYYLRRLLCRSFWGKLISGQIDISKSTSELTSFFNTVASGVESSASKENITASYQSQMLAAFQELRVPLRWVFSGNDLTAKEFENFYHANKYWQKFAKSKSLSCKRLPEADHTFSREVWKKWLFDVTYDVLIKRYDV